MKKSLSTICFTICCTMFATLATAQNSDDEVDRLLNEGSFFELERVYPSLRTRLDDERLMYLADGLLGSYFNRPEEAIEAFDTLLNEYPTSFNFNLQGTLVLLRGINQLVAGRYADAADGVKTYMEELDRRNVNESLRYSLLFISICGEALREYPAPELIRPDVDIKVNVHFKPAGRGEHLMIPVTIGDVTEDFVFDTGCAIFNYVSEKCANDMGIKIIAENIPITGVERGMVKLGIAEQIEIGGVVYRNSVFMIAPEAPNRGGAIAVDAILGADFMKAAGEFSIFAKDGIMLFPYVTSPRPKTGSNMYMRNNQPYLKIFHNNNRLLMHMDTGNAKTVFYEAFYRQERAWVNNNGKRGVTRHAGFGGVKTMVTIRVPAIELKVFNKPITLREVEVIPNDGGAFESPDYGSLGTDFLHAFRVVTINYHDMYVAGE